MSIADRQRSRARRALLLASAPATLFLELPASAIVIHLVANDAGSQGWVGSAPGPDVAEDPVSPARDFLDVDAWEIHDASSPEGG